MLSTAQQKGIQVDRQTDGKAQNFPPQRSFRWHAWPGGFSQSPNEGPMPGQQWGWVDKEQQNDGMRPMDLRVKGIRPRRN